MSDYTLIDRYKITLCLWKFNNNKLKKLKILYVYQKKKKFNILITDFQIPPLPPKKKKTLFCVRHGTLYNIIKTAKARIVKTGSAGCDIFYTYNFFFKYYTIYALSRYNRVCQQCCVHLAYPYTYLSHSSRPLVCSHSPAHHNKLRSASLLIPEPRSSRPQPH